MNKYHIFIICTIYNAKNDPHEHYKFNNNNNDNNASS